MSADTELDALSRRVLGERHADALAVVQGDRTLTAELTDALAAGFTPPDLATTYVHARAGRLAEALEDWRARRMDPRCALCGTSTLRTGWNGTTGVRDGLCGHCTDVVAEHGVDGLLSRVFVLVTGVYGVERPHLAERADECPNRGDGTPWSHLDADELRHFVADPVNGYSFFVTEGQRWRLQTTPGLPPVHTWTTPPTRPKTFMEPSAAANQLAAEAAAGIAKRRAADAWEVENRARRVASMDRMTDEQRAQHAAYEAAQDKRWAAART